MGNKHIRNYSVAKKALKSYFDNDEKKWRAMLVDAKKKGEDTSGIMEHLEKSLPKDRKYWEKRLEDADNAPRMLELHIRVEGKNSRTWGANPHAEVFVCYESKQYGTESCRCCDSASGCGYDKRSAAVNGALRFTTKKRDPEDVRGKARIARACIDRFVIEHGESLWKEYAVERTPIPHFCFGGKGMNTFTRLFRRIGCRPCGEQIEDYLIDYDEPCRGSDVYHVIRKSRI